MPFVGKLDGQLVSLDGLPVLDTLTKREYPTTRVAVDVTDVRCVSCESVMPTIVMARFWRHRSGEGNQRCEERFLAVVCNEGPWHRDRRHMMTQQRRRSGLWVVSPHEVCTPRHRADVYATPKRKRRPRGASPYVEYGPVVDEYQHQEDITFDTITGRITEFRYDLGAETFWHLSHPIWKITQHPEPIPHIVETPDGQVNVCSRFHDVPDLREFVAMDVDKFIHDRARLAFVWHPDFATVGTVEAMARHVDEGNQRRDAERREAIRQQRERMRRQQERQFHILPNCERENAQPWTPSVGLPSAAIRQTWSAAPQPARPTTPMPRGWTGPKPLNPPTLQLRPSPVMPLPVLYRFICQLCMDSFDARDMAMYHVNQRHRAYNVARVGYPIVEQVWEGER